MSNPTDLAPSLAQTTNQSAGDVALCHHPIELESELGYFKLHFGYRGIARPRAPFFNFRSLEGSRAVGGGGCGIELFFFLSVVNV